MDEWSRYEKLVLSELTRLSGEARTTNMLISSLLAKVNLQETEIEKMKIRAGIWGTMGGSVTALVVALMKSLFNPD